jgi:hypothetical protein
MKQPVVPFRTVSRLRLGIPKQLLSLALVHITVYIQYDITMITPIRPSLVFYLPNRTDHAKNGRLWLQ